MANEQEPIDVTPQEPAEKPAEAPPEKKQAAPLEVREGALLPKSGVELSAMLTQIHAGGGFPERFDTPAKRLAAYNLANSLMAGQWQLAINHIAIIHGQMCIYGEFPGTLAERTEQIEDKKIYLLNEKYEEICVANKNINDGVFAAVMKIKRKGREMQEFTYSLEDAKKAGQYPPMKNKWENKRVVGKEPNEESPWHKHFKVMLMRKVQAIGYKFTLPEAFVGVPIAEYDFDLAPDLKDVTPVEIERKQSYDERLKELNARFKTPEGQPADQGDTPDL